MGRSRSLKKSLVALEGKIAEAKTKKDMLKARAQAAAGPATASKCRRQYRH